MKASDLIRRLLVYADNRTLTEAQTAGQEYLVSALDALNAAAQELYLLAPDFLSVREYGLLIHAPENVTIDGLAIGQSNTGTITTWQNWMTGCLLRIPGEPDNRIIYYTDQTDNLLAHQITTASGTRTATIYADALNLPPEIVSVLPGVALGNGRVLHQASGPRPTIEREQDFGFPATTTTTLHPGEPRSYWITADARPTGGIQPGLSIRISPPTDGPDLLTFRARTRPYPVILTDLDAGNDGSACIKEISMPAGWSETFLLPFALQRFSASPFFNNESVKSEIARQYGAAREALLRVHPQRGRPVRLVASY